LTKPQPTHFLELSVYVWWFNNYYASGKVGEFDEDWKVAILNNRPLSQLADNFKAGLAQIAA